jgi:hypothetical protein
MYFEDTGEGFVHPDWGDVSLFALNLSRVTSKFRESDGALARFILAEPGTNFSLRGT